jgi:peptidoglycan DL-endopeptidase CwlO
MSTGSIGGIGSSVSFWQQDQNYWTNVQAQNQASSASSALITSMGDAITAETKGIASIANNKALTRTQAQLTAALKSALQTVQGSSASSPTSTTGSAAIGTGTVPVSANTALITLGIPANSAFTVSDGTNTNSYTSTGTDTVGDLINGLNAVGPTAADVVTYLDSSGKIIVAGTNKTVSVSVGGTFASNIGFGASNDSFQPIAPASSSANSSGSSSSASPSTGTSSTAAATGTTSAAGSLTNTATPFNSSLALQTGSSAESLLASSGASGSLINLLA